MYERIHPGSSLGFLLGSAQVGEPLLKATWTTVSGASPVRRASSSTNRIFWVL